MTDRDVVLSQVRERVDPSPEEREALATAAAALADRTRAALADLGVEGEVVQVGSTARGTWVSGDRDIDLFVRFSPDLSREELERYGLAVGHSVLPDGHEEYAEHPYVKGVFEGFDVDLVPCYAVASAGEIQSAVDRTPFHTKYLETRVDAALAGDVRLLKQFLKGVGAYGSDLRTEGFSGYLTELLCVEYGGFVETLDAAADWQPPVAFDPADHGTQSFDDPLVVIDPTDPERNVAAVVSRENVARLQHYARAFLDDPRPTLFFPEPVEPATPEAVAEWLTDRETTALAVRFPAPDLVEDQLYPQLERSRDGFVRGLEERGFATLRSAAWAAADAVLFVELAVASLPAVERHDGPPVALGEHAQGFFEQYTADPDVYGPFIDGDRYVVERARDVTTAAAFAETRLADVALGAHVASVVENGDYDVLVDEDVAELTGAFGVELAEYFAPEP